MPEEQTYHAPASHTGSVAYIRGTKIEDHRVFYDDHFAYVLMIDGKFVRNPDKDWDQPLALTPGSHLIAVEYKLSVFRARYSFRINIKPGVTYAVKINPGVAGPDERRYCDFSILDATTGTPVTEVRRSNVSGGVKTANFRPID